MGLPLPQSGEAPSSSTSPPDSIPQAVTMPPELKAVSQLSGMQQLDKNVYAAALGTSLSLTNGRVI